MPQNDPVLVDVLLQRLDVDGDRVFEVQSADGSAPAPAPPLKHLRWPCTLRHALTSGCDLTGTPRKSLLRLLAEFTTDATQKHTLLLWCSRGGRDAYAQEVVAAAPSLLDLLQRFGSCHPPLSALLEALPPLAPRMYSLTCAPEEHPDNVQVRQLAITFRNLRCALHCLEKLCPTAGHF